MQITFLSFLKIRCRRFGFLLSCLSTSELETIGQVFSLAQLDQSEEESLREEYDDVPVTKYVPRDQVPTVMMPPKPKPAEEKKIDPPQPKSQKIEPPMPKSKSTTAADKVNLFRKVYRF